MFSDGAFEQWCVDLELSKQTINLIAHIRASPPARRVRSAAGNVSGRYPSKKMGVSIQFESHRLELAAIHEMEHDPDVLAYYDQPGKIKLTYQGKSNDRRVGAIHTPDFFVIRQDRAGWLECKMEERLLELAEEMPHRYVPGSMELGPVLLEKPMLNPSGCSTTFTLLLRLTGSTSATSCSSKTTCALMLLSFQKSKPKRFAQLP